jgi:hypothetical protein
MMLRTQRRNIQPGDIQSGAIQTLLWALSAVAAIVYLGLGSAHQIPCIYILLLLYPLVPQMWPASRPDLDQLLSPHNWAMLWFYIMMVIEPLNVAVLDGKPSIAYVLGDSEWHLNMTMLFIGLAYIAYCWGYRRAARQQRHGGAREISQCPLRFHHFLIGIIFLGLGLISIILLYGGVGGAITYLSTPLQRFLHDDLLNSTWAGLIGGILRPFLPAGVIVLWCGFVEQNRRLLPTFAITGITLLIVPVVLMAAGSFNRGSMIVPLLGMIAVYSARVRRVSLLALMSIGIPGLVLAIYVGTYRASSTEMEDLQVSETRNQIMTQTDIGSQFASILGTSTVLERYGLMNAPRLGKTIASSVLQPVPVLGKPFRNNCGMELYNSLLYQVAGINDQVIPCYFELFVDFSALGIAAGYALIGMAAFRFHSLYKESGLHSGVATYSMFTLGFWFAGIINGSVAVVSQVFIYSVAPSYIILWLTKKDRQRLKEVQSATVAVSPAGVRRISRVQCHAL